MRVLAKRRVRKKDIPSKQHVIRGLENVAVPSLSGPVLSALDLLRSGNESLARVGTVLAGDPSCTVKTLRLANAAGRGTAHRIETVPHAAALLGRNKLEVVIVAAAVSAAVPTQTTKYFDSNAFWMFAAKRASLARQLTDRFDRSNSMVAFTVALLQDVAVPLLAVKHGEGYGKILEAWRADGGDLCAFERQAFDWDHAEVGHDLANMWSLPERVASEIGNHHGECTLDAVRVLASLHDGQGDDDIDEFVARTGEELEVPADDIVAMFEQAGEDASELFSALR